MDETTSVERYPLKYRVKPVLYAVIGVIVGLDSMFLGCGVIEEWNSMNLTINALRCGVFVLMFIPFCILLFAIARSTWFYLYSYRINSTTIEITAPLFGKRYSIDIANVVEITTFVILGEEQLGDARVGHLLIDDGGVSVKLSEILPSWDRLSNQLTQISRAPRPYPWWEIRK